MVDAVLFFWKIFSFHFQTENSKTEGNVNLKENKIVTFEFFLLKNYIELELGLCTLC